jgi:hypothetical protein
MAIEMMSDALAADMHANHVMGAAGAVRMAPHELRRLRITKRESQEKFWGRFGVTQSSGSRFETGLATPVSILLRMYVNGKLSDGDLQG